MVRALVKPGDPFVHRLDGVRCDIREGDIEHAATLAGAFEGIDTVFHLAAVILSPDPTVSSGSTATAPPTWWPGRPPPGCEHFVYVSSASVTYPAAHPVRRSRSWPARRWSRPSGGFAHTIVRPTLVYDEHGGQEFLLFWHYLRALPGGAVHRRRARRASGRSARRTSSTGWLRIAGNPRSYGKTYNFSGAEAVTSASWPS